jgi:hypothetical protein
MYTTLHNGVAHEGSHQDENNHQSCLSVPPHFSQMVYHRKKMVNAEVFLMEREQLENC